MGRYSWLRWCEAGVHFLSPRSYKGLASIEEFEGLEGNGTQPVRQSQFLHLSRGQFKTDFGLWEHFAFKLNRNANGGLKV